MRNVGERRKTKLTGDAEGEGRRGSTSLLENTIGSLFVTFGWFKGLVLNV